MEATQQYNEIWVHWRLHQWQTNGFLCWHGLASKNQTGSKKLTFSLINPHLPDLPSNTYMGHLLCGRRCDLGEKSSIKGR